MERSRIHDKSSCNGAAEYHKQYEVEYIDDRSNGHESGEFVWLDREESRKTSSGHRKCKPGPCETRIWSERYTHFRISLSTYCLSRSLSVISLSVPSGAASEMRLW